MLNPSNCRRLRRRPDDPSVRQLRPGPRREACGILEVVNLFAYRATLLGAAALIAIAGHLGGTLVWGADFLHP